MHTPVYFVKHYEGYKPGQRANIDYDEALDIEKAGLGLLLIRATRKELVEAENLIRAGTKQRGRRKVYKRRDLQPEDVKDTALEPEVEEVESKTEE